MSLKSVLYVGLAASLLALSSSGCSSGEGDGEGAGGATGSGGDEATGGDSGDAGGAEGDTGGAEGDTGGEPGTGGDAGDAEVALQEFKNGDGGVEILSYDGDVADGIQYVNTGSEHDRSELMGLDPDVAPTATWSGDIDGFDDEPGVVVVTAPFNGYNQSVDLEWHFDTPQDLSGKYLIARVLILDDGGYVQGTGAAGGGHVFAKSGEAWDYADGTWTTLEQKDYGTWVELEFDLDNPSYAVSGFDPTVIQGYGLQISTGGAIGDTDPTPATIYVDQITLWTP